MCRLISKSAGGGSRNGLRSARARTEEQSGPGAGRAAPAASAGFTVIELMFAMALTLIVMGAAFTLFSQLFSASQSAASIADMNQNLRGGVDLIARNLTSTAGGIPVGGIPMPQGSGATAVTWPGPAFAAGCGTFPANGGVLSAITPGYQCGPTIVTGVKPQTTDKITTIAIDQVFEGSPLTTPSTYQVPLSLAATGSAAGIPPYPAGCAASPLPPLPSACSGWQVTVVGPAGFNLGSGQYQINAGDLIMFNNTHGYALGMVTAVDTVNNLITFQNTDPLGLNQPGASSGTPASLANSDGTWPATVAYKIDMTTFFLQNPGLGQQPALMEQYDAAPAVPIALGINVLQFHYDLSDGTTGWTGPLVAPEANNLIAKVNLTAWGATPPLPNSTRQIFTNALNTSVTIRDLAYRNKY
jgi:hypothetical protein